MGTDSSQIANHEPHYVAVRAHVIRSGKVLLGLSLSREGFWTTFGGRPKRGEAPADTLRRELQEELGVDVRDFQRLPDRQTTWGGKPGLVAIFAVTNWRGEPQNRAAHEHSAIAWVGRSELESMAMYEQARAEAMKLLSQQQEERCV